ncbi:copper resistance CopC family protein [Actinomadura rayongensis]|uniref:Copper resistance protein CopC n=1 Tax=Actinomadura rayongensis TaxID=1429076 RepID=A0A6I4WAY3_9ACTN|nr:copper resistance CopC family protein [Actinomadura rayongensis]MXQ65186.1 copper resistance protein CopC [Actinomadura rayongensis]
MTTVRSRIAALVAAGGVLLAVPATPASAHTALRSTSPRAGATVADPGRVTLTYADPILVPRVVVTGPDGVRVQVGPPHAVDATVTQAVRTGLPGGVYTVGWRVVSPDGHPISGSFTFRVSGSGAAPTSAPAATPSTAARQGTSSAGWLWIGLGAAVLAALAAGATYLRRSRRA